MSEDDYTPAERPADERSNRVSFEGEVERQQTDQLFGQMMDQVSQSFPLIGRTIREVTTSDDLGWKLEDRVITITFTDGGVVELRGEVKVIK